MTCRAFFLALALLAAPLAAPAWAAPAKAGIGAQDWGTTQRGERVRLFTLTGKGGMVARITNFGGVVVENVTLHVPLLGGAFGRRLYFAISSQKRSTSSVPVAKLVTKRKRLSPSATGSE